MLLLMIVLGGLLNRLRGGLFSNITGARQQTQAMRLLWAFPTSSLTCILLGADWLVFGEMVLMTWLSWVALGHGAHMVYDRRRLEVEHFAAGGQDVESTTAFWLPALFGGKPNDTWPTWRIYLFHMVGLGAIGMARCAIATLPLWFVPGAWPMAAIYIASGALHGPLYLLGYQTRWQGDASEVITGSWCWLVLYLSSKVV